MPGDRGLRPIAHEMVRDGVLELEADPGPIWALRVDGQPVISVVATAEGDNVELADIHLLSDGVAGRAFHAPDGLVFALPRAGPHVDPTTPQEPVRAELAVARGLTFGNLVSSTAQQFGVVTEVTSPLRITGAAVRVRGIPTMTGDAIALDFPNAALAATGAGLSELSFTLTSAPTPVGRAPTAGPAARDVLGYTRSLAARKLASRGLLADVSPIIVTERSAVGCVIRQDPAAGATVAAGGTSASSSASSLSEHQ